MKKIIAIIAMALVAGAASADILSAWDFYGNPANQSTQAIFAATFYTNTLNAAPTLSRGAGITAGATGSNRWNIGVGWSATLVDAIANNDYFAFELHTSAGINMSITQISIRMYDLGSFTTVPTSLVYRVSTLSDFSTFTDLAPYSAWKVNNSFTNEVDVTGFDNISDFFVRVYAFGDAITNGTGQLTIQGGNNGQSTPQAGLYGTDYDLVIQGTTSVVPEPATALLFGIGGFGAWMLRRNSRKAKEEQEG